MSERSKMDLAFQNVVNFIVEVLIILIILLVQNMLIYFRPMSEGD